MTFTCPLCQSSHIEKLETGLPSFTHLDFSNLVRDSMVALCKDCQLTFNAIDPVAAKTNDQTFCSKSYSQSQQTIQTIKVREFDQPVSRSFLQAELISLKFNKKKDPVILDIGCFDGALLKELDQRLPGAQLHGFDVNEYMKDAFIKKSNFHLWLGDMKAIQGSFDLICFSHSIMYVKDIHGLMEQVKRLLKSDGMIYVQTADIVRNPFSLLLGDQYYYYTPETLKNIFAFFGFGLSIERHPWFSRELLGFASIDPKAKMTLSQEELPVHNSLRYLKEIQGQLNEIQGSSIRVLGTTANAAFVDSVLNGKNAFFIDENTKRIGQKFRSKDICSPDVLEEIDTLVIPYRENSRNISARFKEKYKGQFVCV